MVDDNTRALMQYDAAKRTALVTYLLWFFLGFLGVHRFYLGKTGSGIIILVLMLLGFVTLGITSVIAGIWLIVDIFLIPGMVDDYNSNLADRLG